MQRRIPRSERSKELAKDTRPLRERCLEIHANHQAWIEAHLQVGG